MGTTLKHRILLIAAFLLALGGGSEMMAQTGTAAGTAITNQASVDYYAGSDARNETSNTTTLYVAHKVVINFSADQAATTVDNVTRYYNFTVTNSGNRNDNFSLTTADLAGVPAGTWDVEIVQTGSSTVVTETGTLAPGASFSGRLKVVIPASQTDGTVKVPTLRATSTAADDAGNNIVVANPGEYEETTVTITIGKPVITFSASQSDVSTNGAKIPGQNVTYTMTIQNTGSAAVNGDATVTMDLDPNYKYISSTGSGSLSGADGSGNGGTVTWTIPAASLGASGSSLTREVVAQIQQTTNSGTGPASGTTVTAMTTASGTQTKILLDLIPQSCSNRSPSVGEHHCRRSTYEERNLRLRY